MRRARAARRRIGLALVVGALLLTTACRDSRASRLEEKARTLARDGKYQDAIVLLERVQKDFPNTHAGKDAGRQIVLYRGFLEADLKRNRRRAKDDLWAIARALLEHHERWKRYPEAVTGLAAAARLPRVDPWGTPYSYSPTPDGRSYHLGCLGADGVRGGTGDDRDLIVVDGEFVKDLPWEDR